MNKDILLCGVGGQGTVLAAKILAAAAMNAGEKVRSCETIGMAQREGSVTSHVRIGDSSSPLIPRAKADILMAFEPDEAVRNLDYLKREGIVIVNRAPVKPVTESLQQTGYDGTEMIEYLGSRCRCIVMDSGELDSEKFLNIAMLGVAVGTGRLGFDREEILAEIETRVPAKFLEANRQAFLKGIAMGENR